MKIPFEGKWRATITKREAGFSQRVVVGSATSGNGSYNGVVGNSFVFEDGWVELQWNNNAGSGWQESAVISSVGMTSPLVVVKFVSADDNFPNQRDGDYDDLQVRFEHLDAPFEVTQRPYALDRGSLAMFPDGIFDASQGIQYMGVRIKNTWFFDWQSNFPATGMKIGIAPVSRSALSAAGIMVIDSWTPQEQEGLGQIMDGGFVRVPDIKINEETTIYFKLDVSNANPSKPEIGFVAQRDAYDPRYDEPTRIVDKKIFISRSSYNPATRELVTAIPEGTLYLKLNKIAIDRKGATKAAQELKKCLKQHGGGIKGMSKWLHKLSRGFWQNSKDKERWCKEQGNDALRKLLKQLLDGKDIDICHLKAILDQCCERPGGDCECCPCGDGDGRPGGWDDGTGVDGWCRVKPVFWLPLDFEYKVVPNPAYIGQFGPLAFEDPWWKVVLIILAIILAIASVIYDYVYASEDDQYIIGQVVRNGDAPINLVDAAVSNLNGSRGVDLGQLDAQGNDINNGSPITVLDSIIQLDRTAAGSYFGTLDAVLGNVVWKSGATSATTRGFISTLGTSVSIPYDEHDTLSDTVTYINEVVISELAAIPQTLSDPGDSGSVWVDLATARPVALNYGSPTDSSDNRAFANPIRSVIDVLNLRF
ncbi:TPA: hypothetical protein JBG74_02210 [Legionella pneumophila]|uniref:Uncharacterized protein n=2 Tax=Legionella pneumophila TaxID=446 RepID=Q5ZYV3_LEGPH|nr:hypothetical protein [Legionella pneumophila]WBV62914.1 hypothetical protein PGH43_14315 [Legionella pneumophila 130b]AAU26365.1 hypothetical protein lpg0258 [Legionella pneumophila subsp. pneumophila str. Philadelphia 1]AEW50549.1 hypothetical protein lp12_0262 [Legionella pneumophila subsp. pneumophila ATCC 43290]AGH55057.1 hypothetical protein LPE509_02966 [Legionella pneumophila subsp. pneumophila LPE509]AGN13183.1 hypothetical protein LP6_0259 [Legionella pneumophila subsp. pneumophila